MARLIRTTRSGFTPVDVVVALTVLGLMLALLWTSVARRTQFATRSAAQRQLIRQVEGVLMTLEAGQAAQTPDHMDVQVQRLPAEAPKGMTWVTVTGTRTDDRRQQAELTGLVPITALPSPEVTP